MCIAKVIIKTRKSYRNAVRIQASEASVACGRALHIRSSMLLIGTHFSRKPIAVTSVRRVFPTQFNVSVKKTRIVNKCTDLVTKIFADIARGGGELEGA